MRQISPRSTSYSLIHLLLASAIVLFGFFLSARPAVCDGSEAAAELSAAKASSTKTYGLPLELPETVPMAEILEDPAAFQGKRVRVEGRVREVCPKKGCWMDLVPSAVADGREETLRIKVDDDVIVFPQDAVGALAIAEGVVEVTVLDRERYISWLAHQAEERGEAFNPSSVGEGPFQWVQIKGTGALLSLR